jgi:hypothetical protein
LPSDQQNSFAVEVLDRAEQTVLTVPCKEAEKLTPATKHLDKESPPGLLI